ncbi:MAG TPA: hypothetical protein VII47_08435 [Actinomycetota bacterium]
MQRIIRRTIGTAAALLAALLFLAVPMAHAASNGHTDTITTAAVDGCHSIGGGKYNCYVYADAPSYFSGDVPAGVLHAGWNYFYCQLSGSERYFRGHQNHWFGVTDDDSGNRHVYVNVVYVSGGNDDEPVPGLPVGGC